MSHVSSANDKALFLMIEESIRDAKTVFQVSPIVQILSEKAFSVEVKDKARGGTYNYFKDCIFLNTDVLKLRSKKDLRWTIYHEFAHALCARIFAKEKFFPGTVIYGAELEDDLLEHGVKTMWNGLCDYLVNELVSLRTSLKKFDTTTEQTVDDLPMSLRVGMCFHLYDYWKHGRDQRVRQKSRTKIPLELLNLLDAHLPHIPLDRPVDAMVQIFRIVIDEIFKMKMEVLFLSKRDIEAKFGASLPEFWGPPDTELGILCVRGW